MNGVYLTRDSYDNRIEVWPDTVGIRKFHGCNEYGAAHCEIGRTFNLYPKRPSRVESIGRSTCYKRYGFYPRKGTAWWVSATGKRRVKVDLAFSN